MTQSDEESEAEWQPWVADEILSRHYEYPDEEDGVGSSNQGGTYEDGNMYENNEDYKYDVEDDFYPCEYL